jgi:hypothetical protein
MRTPEKLLRMLTFLGGKYPVRLDAMSINQTDEDDKKHQLVVMGDIYRKAEIVSIFLPAADEGVYMKLKQFAITADDIVARCEEFQLAKTSAEKQHMDSFTRACNKVPRADGRLGEKYRKMEVLEKSNGFLFGSPIFIGRADTVTHIRNSLE